MKLSKQDVQNAAEIFSASISLSAKTNISITESDSGYIVELHSVYDIHPKKYKAEKVTKDYFGFNENNITFIQIKE